MQFCDNNPNIVAWASEPVKINYMHPLTGKLTVYVPDFIITYIDAKGNKLAEVIEIKTCITIKTRVLHVREVKAQQVVVNYAKWEAATKWAKKRGMRFRVLNEGDILRKYEKTKS